MFCQCEDCFQLYEFLYFASKDCAIVSKVDAKLFSTGIGLTLNNVNYTNNSVVNITDIGTGSAALNCTTTYRPCCYSKPPPGTHWYFPNGSQVSNTNTLPYYRTRIDANPHFTSEPGTVLLHHNPVGTTTGIFRCEIRDAIGDFKSIYVGIYTTTTGESCALMSNKFVQQKPMRA